MSAEHSALDPTLRRLAEAVADGLLRLLERGGYVIVEPAQGGAWRLRDAWEAEDAGLCLSAEAWPHLVPEVDPDSDEGRAWTEAGLRDVLVRSLLRSGQAQRLRNALHEDAVDTDAAFAHTEQDEVAAARRAHFALEPLLQEAALGRSARIAPPPEVDGLRLGLSRRAVGEQAEARGARVAGDAFEAVWITGADPDDRLHLEFDDHDRLRLIQAGPRAVDRLYAAQGLGPRGAARQVMTRHRVLRMEVVAAGLSYAWEADAPAGARLRISPYIKQLTLWQDADRAVDM